MRKILVSSVIVSCADANLARHTDTKLQSVEGLTFAHENLAFPLKTLTQVCRIFHPEPVLTKTQAHADGSAPFRVMDVGGADIPSMGLFSSRASGGWAEMKFRMFGYVLIPRLKPIPLSWFVSTDLKHDQMTLTFSDPACAGAVTIATASS